MSGVFQNIDLLPPLRPARGGGGHTRWVERGFAVNSLEDARHCSVLCICKYFVGQTIPHSCFFFCFIQVEGMPLYSARTYYIYKTAVV
jgi:hypothetical protein